MGGGHKKMTPVSVMKTVKAQATTGTIFYWLIAMPQIVIVLFKGETINLCFMCNFDIKISVSHCTYF